MVSAVVGTLLLVTITMAMPLTIIATLNTPTDECTTTGTRAGAQMNLITCNIDKCKTAAAEYYQACRTTTNTQTTQINNTPERNNTTTNRTR